LINDAADAMGGLDILVNNAGRQIAIDDIAELTDEQVRHTFETNILAMFTLCRNAVKIMERGSAIINTTSIQAYQPSPQLIDYASTKAAINNFAKGLAAQVAEKGIRVNAVAPGPIWTPLQPSRGQFPEKLPNFGKDTWLGRAGQPAELAPAYVFLATDEASYVVGSTVHVNGGEPPTKTAPRRQRRTPTLRMRNTARTRRFSQTSRRRRGKAPSRNSSPPRTSAMACNASWLT